MVETSHGHLANSVSGDTIEPDDQFTLAEVLAGEITFVAEDAIYAGAGGIALTLSDGVARATPDKPVFVGVTIFDAQFTVLASGGYDFDRDDPIGAMGSGAIDQLSESSTTFTIAATDGRHFAFIGTGFDFEAAIGGDRVFAGTITGITELGPLGEELSRFTVNVPAVEWFNAVVAYSNGDGSLIEALARGWTFYFSGGAGADAFGAADLNDLLIGRAGSDSLDGQFGYDRANYGAATDAINVQLAAGTVSGDSSVGVDTLKSIELVTGSNYADSFDATGFSSTSQNAGSTVTNNVFGLFNEFEGRGGDDTITGNGQTRVSYFHATAGVTVTLAANSWTSPTSGASGTATGDASVGTDTFTGVNNVRGSFFDDAFYGSNNPNFTSENFEGLGGDDLIDGGTGFDRAYYNQAFDGVGINVNLSAGTVTGGLATGTDTLRSIEAIWGTNFDDTYDATGFSGVSTNAGNAGNNGAASSLNEFEGGGGADTVIGNGNTRVYYGHATGGVVVTLGSGGSGDSYGNASVGHDIFNSGVTRVRGSEFNDIITGNTEDNILEGQGGSDIIDGRGGNDALTGGTGSDIFVYGQSGGADTIADFNRAQGDRIDLRAFSGIHTVADVQALASGVGSTQIDFGAGNTLTLNGIAPASLKPSDFIFAGQVAVTVQTADGYDFGTLYDDMAAGVVSVAASDGDHIFVVNAAKGITFEIKGAGIYDTVNHQATAGLIAEINILHTTNPAEITQDLVLVNTNGWNGAGAIITAADLFDGIAAYQADSSDTSDLDDFFNTPSYSVVGTAGFADNHSKPHDGADVFFGGNNADIFNGGPGPFGPQDPGSDTVDYSHATSGSGVSVNLLTGATSGSAAAGDVFISIENLRGTDFDDVLTGDSNNNVIEGGLGNNTLDGGSNGYGPDVVSYEHATAGVTVSLVAADMGTPQTTGGAGIDTLYNFEGIRGSAHDDTLKGGGNTILEGGAGNDTLIGLVGGSDTASYQHATAGVTVDLSNVNPQNTVGAGTDTLTDIANVFGSSFNDTLTGNSGDNLFFGNDGRDIFVFNASMGHDVIGDFIPGEEKIDLNFTALFTDEASFQGWASTSNHIVQQGSDTLISFDVADSILLKGVSSTNLHASDFILHPGGN
ncbi:MAG: calcium-binding protein [bacterium]|nr:calcium-binding protein [bacterium]